MSTQHKHTTKSLTAISVALTVLLGGVVEVHAQLHFGEPENLGPVVNTSEPDWGASISTDGLTLYYVLWDSPAHNSPDLWMTMRAGLSDPWQTPVNLGPVVNTVEYWEGSPCISTDGLALYFFSNRPGGFGGRDIWMTIRTDLSDPWQPPVNLGPAVNSSATDTMPYLSSDGRTLILASGRSGGLGLHDLWMSTRASPTDPWGPAVNLGPPVNSQFNDTGVSLSEDGLTLFFDSRRDGGQGGWDLWMATRPSLTDPWTLPVNLGPTVNTVGTDRQPDISADGLTLFFDSDRPGGIGSEDLWQVAVFPCHGDLNRDGEVGLADLAQLLANFGTPSGMTYGDGDLDGDADVDLADLAALLAVFGTTCP